MGKLINLEKDRISKHRLLNEVRERNLSLVEMRFFCIYLSLINPLDVSSRVVRLPLSEYLAIMELGRVVIDELEKTTRRLLSRVVSIPNNQNGYDSFQLFKRCRVFQEPDGEWFFEIDSHDDALPYMFDLKDYFSYETWNVLRLKSTNQMYFFDLLKQHEKAGWLVVTVEELRGRLGIDPGAYPRFGDFKVYVLDACQKAFRENTDIAFDYEPHGRKGKGGKITALKFVIRKNADHKNPLSLKKFMEQYTAKFNDKAPHPKQATINVNEISGEAEALELEHEGVITGKTVDMVAIRDMLNDMNPGFSFTTRQIQNLYGYYKEQQGNVDEMATFRHFRRCYEELLAQQDNGTAIKNVYGYLKKLITNK